MYLHADGIGSVLKTGHRVRFLLRFRFQTQHVDVALPDVNDLLRIAGIVLQMMPRHQQRLTKKTVQIHAGFQTFAGDDIFINLAAVAADAGVHFFQFTVFGLQFIHQLMLMGCISRGDLNRTIQHFLMEGPDCTIRQTEFRLFTKGDARYRLNGWIADQSLPEQIRVLNGLAKERVAQLIHPVIGQQHQTIGL